MNWPFNSKSNPSEPPALDAKDEKIYELAIRIAELEKQMCDMSDAVTELCLAIRQHIDRIDLNTTMLDKNMHKLAEMTLRPPKDLLGGNQETN